jgi:uncharacterized protein (TIGR03435 family)
MTRRSATMIAAAVFAAMEKQLGLKLESRKKAVTVMVIDHVERVPADN